MTAPHINRSARTGVSLALVTAGVSGVAVFLNASAVRQFSDAATYTTLKNAVAAVVLLAVMAALGGLPRTLGARSWAGLVALGVIGGSVPFLLFFTGLAEASAPAAAVIHKTLFIWVALLAIVLLRERIGAWQVGALVVLLAAQLMVQPPTGVSLGGGEALIALATGLWAVETIVAKRLLRSVPTLVAGSGRMAFGLVVLVGYLAVTGRLALVAELGIVQWVWVLGTGALLAVYVGTWYAALQRAPAVTVAAVLTLGAPVTAGLQLIASGSLPAAGSIAGYLMIVLAGGALAAGLLWVRDRERRTAAAG